MGKLCLRTFTRNQSNEDSCLSNPLSRISDDGRVSALSVRTEQRLFTTLFPYFACHLKIQGHRTFGSSLRSYFRSFLALGQRSWLWAPTNRIIDFWTVAREKESQRLFFSTQRWVIIFSTTEKTAELYSFLLTRSCWPFARLKVSHLQTANCSHVACLAKSSKLTEYSTKYRLKASEAESLCESNRRRLCQRAEFRRIRNSTICWLQNPITKV